MGVLLLSGCGNTGKSAVAAASSTSASEISNEAGKGTKVSQPAENVDAQVAEASLPQPGEAISASLAWKSRMELAYATQFAVDTYEDADGMQYEAVSVADGSRFLLIPEGGKVPEDLPDSIQVLKRPVKQIYLVATATMDMFRMLGALPDIRFSGTDASGWYIPEAKEAMENGSILYAGKYSEPDYERIVSEGCGLAIENTMILHSPEVKEKLESFGIPVLVDHSSYEAHPLGRTEWIRLYGVLTGKEKEAEAAFARQEAALQRVTEEGSDAENAGGSVKTEQTAQAEKPSAAFSVFVVLFYVAKLFRDFRHWEINPAILDYCFSLFAMIAFMLASYHAGAFSFERGARRRLAFYSLLGVLFGAISLAGAQLPELLIYAGSVFWMLACAQQMLRRSV